MEGHHWDPAQFAWNPEAMVRALAAKRSTQPASAFLALRAEAPELQVATPLASAPPEITAEVAFNGAAAGGAETSANRGAQAAPPLRPQAVCQIAGCGAALDDERSNGYNMRTKLWCVPSAQAAKAGNFALFLQHLVARRTPAVALLLSMHTGADAACLALKARRTCAQQLYTFLAPPPERSHGQHASVKRACPLRHALAQPVLRPGAAPGRGHRAAAG